MLVRTSLFILLTIAFNPTNAQTYFYVESISVDPPNPTAMDMITLNVSGNLSSTGSFVQSTSYALSGMDIDLTIDCGSTGGLAVLVPHTEAINLGMLPAGMYHMNIGGVGTGDFVTDTSDYYFTVSGTTSIEALQPDMNEMKIALEGGSGNVLLWVPTEESVEYVEVFNSEGKLLNSWRGSDRSPVTISLPQRPNGALILRVRTSEAVRTGTFAAPN